MFVGKKYISLLCVALMSLTWFGAARAEHEANHRYTMRGYVLDANKQPLAGQQVLVAVGQVSGTATTDEDGYYSIKLHLHDTDLGKQLQISAGKNEASLRVAFKVGDEHTERRHYVNFVGDQLVEEQLDRGGLPIWGYAALVLLALGGGWAVFGRRHRRPAAATQSTQSSRKKKRHKRKRR